MLKNIKKYIAEYNKKNNTNLSLKRICESFEDPTLRLCNPEKVAKSRMRKGKSCFSQVRLNAIAQRLKIDQSSFYINR